MKLIRWMLLSNIMLLLFGCASLSQPEQVSPIQSNLLTKCAELTKHEGTTGAMVLSTMVRWATEYNECAARHNNLVDAVTKGK